MSESTILAPLDVANLASHGLLGPGRTTGSLRIHKRRLNASSDEEHHHIPLNISLESPAARDAFATIPAVLISRETLVYVGLSEAKATELWDQWINWPASGPGDGGLQVTFIDFITGTLQNQVNTAEDDDLQWRARLNACGIAVNVQDAIMDPHFKYLRLSESCLFWAKDTIEMRYAGLKDIQRLSCQREMELRRAASRPSGDPVEHGGVGRQGGQNLTDSSSLTGQGHRSISGLQQQSTPGVGADIWGSASAIAARNAPGHIVLFKGLDQGRIAGLSTRMVPWFASRSF
ncbi:hypothetical protein TOPH_07846 [Tolypocladium ophioglossoides CBS 100239]|uniref:Uncharacterized protein n=1 Tax=Tolypocladium ophioglossoides (strain CBS 100239) TaxID=1163406 RepID=A0A0L0N072_TOLOC|nr:hypothetical protein TOPH_07846 [Tolypocladium ophioglossoides CBS 100239]